MNFKFLGRILVALVALAVSAEAVTYQYFRFTPTRVRSGFNSRTVQLSEMTFYSATGPITSPVPTVSNPGGNNPDGEGPGNLVDGNTGTKWLDFDRSPVVFNFGVPVNVHHYGFTTANDAEGRDPVRWRFEGSNNGTNWTILDSRTSTVNYPTTRLASYEFFFNQVTTAPEVTFSAASGAVVSSKGLNVQAGGNVTLSWQVEDADEVAVTRGATVLATSGSGSLTVNPTATTTYTVSGTNAGGVTSRAITVHVGVVPEAPVINEFLAKADDDDIALLDEDYAMSDWVELYNPNEFAVSLAGYGLTDKSDLNGVWNFPSGSFVDAGGYLVVFASGKDRSVAGQTLHTNFSLSADGEYLAVVGKSGSVVGDFGASYKAQYDDVSYGRVAGGGLDFFTGPTPGAANDTVAGAPGELVVFTTPPGTFSGTKEVVMSVASAEAEIRYTLDGEIPTSESALYTGAISLSATTMVKARSFQAGRAPGEVLAGGFIRITAGAEAVSSDLPIIVIENFGAGNVPTEQVLQGAHFSLFEPDGVTGRTTLAAAPTVASRTGIKRRGSSTINDPKGSYRVEFWQDGSDEERDVNLLGMSNHDEWVLYAPYVFDRALIRNPFLFGLSNGIGTYAPRTRFCEVYLNTDGGSLDAGDYQGVYVLMERISRDGDRVDVERMRAWHDSEPEVSGGYILSIDRLDPGDNGFRSALNHPSDPPNASPQPHFTYVYPKEQNITPAQSSYIRGYVDDLESALYGPNFKDPETGYAAWLDVDASIDHHILVTFSKDPDGLRLSTYLYKPRGGKLAFGPLWDFDRAMGADNDDRSANPQGWQAPYETAEYFEYDYWGRLFQDVDFMQKWIDRWQELRRGEMSDVAMAARVDGMAGELAESQVRNQQRWPSVSPNGGPLSSLPGYAGEVDHLKNWLAQRGAWIDSQFVAPPYVQAGGAVEAGETVALQVVQGEIFYTLDGSDPRLAGGGIHPGAILYTGVDPVMLVSGTLTARSYAGGQWSGKVMESYVVGNPADAASLVVSEIMYHPADPTPEELAAGYANDGFFEFMELQNVSTETVELSGVVISECFGFDFTGGVVTTLEPGEVVLVVRNRAAFELRYGTGYPIAGEWGDPSAADGGQSLSNSGERILITAADGTVIQDFSYDDGGVWPRTPDGDGPSLVLVNPFGLPNHALAESWVGSAAAGGTPGAGGTFYEYWARSKFGVNLPGGSGPEEDPDGDGLVNLIEFAFGTDPFVGSGEALPGLGFEEIEVAGETNVYLTLTFTRMRDLPGYGVQAEFGDDLVEWGGVGVLVETVRHDDGSESVTYRDAVPADGTRRFGRVRVGRR